MAQTIPTPELDARFEMDPAKALGFRKGEPYSQTRWRFVGV